MHHFSNASSQQRRIKVLRQLKQKGCASFLLALTMNKSTTEQRGEPPLTSREVNLQPHPFSHPCAHTHTRMPPCPPCTPTCTHHLACPHLHSQRRANHPLEHVRANTYQTTFIVCTCMQHNSLAHTCASTHLCHLVHALPSCS